jgi:hypothetical protein
MDAVHGRSRRPHPIEAVAGALNLKGLFVRSTRWSWRRLPLLVRRARRCLRLLDGELARQHRAGQSSRRQRGKRIVHQRPQQTAGDGDRRHLPLLCEADELVVTATVIRQLLGCGAN